MKAIVLCLLILLIPSGWVQAQPLAKLNSITDLILVAVEQDHNVQLSELQLLEVNKSIERLEASLRPQFNLTGEYVLENLANQPLGGLYVIRGAEYDELVHTQSGALTVAKQLGLNNQLKTAFQQSKIGKDLIELQRQQAAGALVIRVQEYYNNLLKTYSGAQLALEAVEHATLNLEITKEKISDGLATPLDALREQNILITAQNNLATATNGLDVSLLAMLQLVGHNLEQLEAGRIWTEELYKDHIFQKEPWRIKYEQALEYGLANRIELQMLRKKIEQAQVEYQGIAGNKDWTVNLQGHYLLNDYVLQGSLDSERTLIGTLYRSNTTYPDVKDFDEEDYWDKLPDQWKSEELEQLHELLKEIEGSIGLGTLEQDVNPWQVSLNLNYQFGDGGAKKARTEQAILGIKKAELEYDKAMEGITLEIFALYQEFVGGWRAIELSQLLLEEALETYHKLEEMFQIGLITNKELSESRLLVNQAKHNFFSAKLDYELYQAKLAQAMGIDLVDLISGVSYGKWPEYVILQSKGRFIL